MNTQPRSTPATRANLLAVLLSLLCSHLVAAPLGTAFTYQGRLISGAAPASGNYDLRFAVFDAAASGAQLGVALTNAATPVANGVFTVTLDFGAGVFDDAVRWLGIGVRHAGGGAFTLLTPRQPLAPAPHALSAPSAQAASANAAHQQRHTDTVWLGWPGDVHCQVLALPRLETAPCVGS